MTISELISLISESNINSSKKENDDVIYNSQELLENYQMFSKYNLYVAIKKENLPFFRIGHKRYFKKSAIDNWIKENNKPLITIKLKGQNGNKSR